MSHSTEASRLDAPLVSAHPLLHRWPGFTTQDQPAPFDGSRRSRGSAPESEPKALDAIAKERPNVQFVARDHVVVQRLSCGSDPSFRNPILRGILVASRLAKVCRSGEIRGRPVPALQSIPDRWIPSTVRSRRDSGSTTMQRHVVILHRCIQDVCYTHPSIWVGSPIVCIRV